MKEFSDYNETDWFQHGICGCFQTIHKLLIFPDFKVAEDNVKCMLGVNKDLVAILNG